MAKAPAKRKTAKKSAGVPTVERKIHFYRINCGVDEAGERPSGPGDEQLCADNLRGQRDSLGGIQRWHVFQD